MSRDITEQEFRNFIGEPLTRTRAEVREHFNLNHTQVKILLRKYGLTEYTLTGARRNKLMEEYLKENPGITYQELADHFKVDYRRAYRFVQSRKLRHLITEVGYEERHEKAKETLMERYGVENAAHIEEANKKRKKTNLKKYGHEYVIASKHAREKSRETMLERYGVENPMQIEEVREKIEKTMLERYGVKNPFQSEEIRKKIIATNYKRYGARQKPHTPEQIEKWRATMQKRYGDESPMKTPEAITKARKTLLNNKYRKSRGWFTINEENVKLLLDVEVFKEEMKKYETKPTIIEFIKEKELPARTVYNFIQNNNLYEYFELNNWGTSNPEKEIKEYLISIGVKEGEILTNDRQIIKPYEVDLYLPKYKLGIEFNGTYWHSTLFSDDKKAHQRKPLLLEEKGIQLYQIFEYDWNKEQKRKIIKSQLRNLLKKNNRIIYARQCEIREVDNKTTKEFMENNHMQGDGNLSRQINYGLYYKNELVYMMTFGKWRRGYKGIIDYEIFRSSTILNTTVIGGASKLFKHFIREYPNKTVGTYSNIQTGNGHLYKILGFEYQHTTEPTSIKVNRRGEVSTLFSREYQESRNMEDSKEFYYEIYNTGSKLWIYNKDKTTEPETEENEIEEEE